MILKYRNNPYPIEFTTSFIIFWGLSLTISFLTGGLLFFGLTASMVIVLISHEYAHLKECERLLIPVKEIKFTWLGGMVNADIRYSHEAVPVLLAGVIDTAGYCIAFTELLFALNFLGRGYLSVNMANNPYIGFFQSAVGFALIMTITNILPIAYNHKRHGLITTDGWGAWIHRELRDELLNDGKAEAINSEVL